MIRVAPGLSTRQLALGCVAATVIQLGFFSLLVLAGRSEAHVRAVEEKAPQAVPIAVKPVLDEVPLLKLGSKQDKLKPKLPDMWKKQAPVPVKRYEEVSAPSEKAEDTPAAIPKAPVVDNKQAPPPDAEIAKEVPELLDTPEPDQPPPPELEEEGVADGSKDGTETDPMKGRAVDLYRSKILAWFNSRFRPPQGEVPCEELKKLSAGLVVQVGADRTVTGFSITSPSGNAAFDAKVTSTLSAIVGQELPPPPPLYPDILGSTVYPRLSGAGVQCD